MTEPTLVFDFPDQTGAVRRRVFARPVETIVARRLDEVRPALRAVQRAAEMGLYAVGYVAYEAAPAFDPAFVVRKPADLPLLWFGLFRAPGEQAVPAARGEFELSDWRPATPRDEYDRAIAAVRSAIGRGDTYQVNYTMRLRARFAGDAFALYEQLRAAQAASYCAYLDLGRRQILSLSPELFFRGEDGAIPTRPMKGTAPRGRWPAEDQALADWLAASEKNRAENLMIVDLLRNDLGRVAEIGSVAVPSLFAVERYRTVHQLTSTVTARSRPGTALEDIFAALFPCGSITGAPKVATMRLIADLETDPRGAYCGAVGLVEPGGVATFNVAIRTAVIDYDTQLAEYGVGGGITWDSTSSGEYDEALLKAVLLTERWPTFDLLETLRLEGGAYHLLDRHLARLAASADYFGIPVLVEQVRAALDTHARTYPGEARRVRLLVSQYSEPRVESQPLLPQWEDGEPFLPPLPARERGDGGVREVAWARAPVSRRDRFLFHKTTHRATYAARRAERPELYDVLLWNEEGEATEFTVGNLVAELDGQLWTPPLDSGLLAGTLRAELLERGEIRERTLSRGDIGRAANLWSINSVRGWVRVVVVP
jgi:para-aminobenzoate synthetase/4-amino-4-deoxychorismate lyase